MKKIILFLFLCLLSVPSFAESTSDAVYFDKGYFSVSCETWEGQIDPVLEYHWHMKGHVDYHAIDFDWYLDNNWSYGGGQYNEVRHQHYFKDRAGGLLHGWKTKYYEIRIAVDEQDNVVHTDRYYITGKECTNTPSINSTKQTNSLDLTNFAGVPWGDRRDNYSLVFEGEKTGDDNRAYYNSKDKEFSRKNNAEVVYYYSTGRPSTLLYGEIYFFKKIDSGKCGYDDPDSAKLYEKGLIEKYGQPIKYDGELCMQNKAWKFKSGVIIEWADSVFDFYSMDYFKKFCNGEKTDADCENLLKD